MYVSYVVIVSYVVCKLCKYVSYVVIVSYVSM